MKDLLKLIYLMADYGFFSSWINRNISTLYYITALNSMLLINETIVNKNEQNNVETSLINPL